MRRRPNTIGSAWPIRKAPENYGAFVDAYLPYGGSIAYRDEGYAVLGTAHGISVLERVFEAGALATAETSMEDLALYYQAMLEENGETLEALGAVQYHAEYDIAVQQARAVSGDGVHESSAVLYSDTRGAAIIFRRSSFTGRSSLTAGPPLCSRSSATCSA